MISYDEQVRIKVFYCMTTSSIKIQFLISFSEAMNLKDIYLLTRDNFSEIYNQSATNVSVIALCAHRVAKDHYTEAPLCGNRSLSSACVDLQIDLSLNCTLHFSRQTGQHEAK